jgi:ribosome assembly protein YihI (activator of Der GTPase)
MQTKDISQELTTVMETLTAEGKEPTVALVKSRLTTKVPIPAIVATIKSWKSTQRIPKVEVKTLSDKERIEQLEQQVAELAKRLTLLEARETAQQEKTS